MMKPFISTNERMKRNYLIITGLHTEKKIAFKLGIDRLICVTTVYVFTLARRKTNGVEGRSVLNLTMTTSILLLYLFYLRYRKNF